MDMKSVVLLSVLLMSACTAMDKTVFYGKWIEVMPKSTWCVQGLCLKEDGRAESIGMRTLKYDSWALEDEKLILNGNSIGNVQTLAFSDTLDIVSLCEDTLVLGKGGQYRIEYVRQPADLKSVKLKSVSGGREIELIFSKDSADVQLGISPDEIFRLLRRQRTDGISVWNLEDDDTYLVEKKNGEWCVSRRGQLLYTTSGEMLP